ncbi:MAG: hypothetical protein JSW34_06590 [Candidatus Zixiibacteriota bacterium]|nr:MAG: hypothetical protein JSW34_06590 [candidate division Zixibacteria bacterium]
MKRKSTAVLSTVLFLIFVMSMVTTIYSTSYAGHPRFYVCCTKVLANGTVIEGVKLLGQPDGACSYQTCVETVGLHFCNCSITR